MTPKTNEAARPCRVIEPSGAESCAGQDCFSLLTSMNGRLARMEGVLVGSNEADKGFIAETRETLKSHGKDLKKVKAWQIAVTAGFTVGVSIVTWLLVHFDTVKTVAEKLKK